MNAQDLEELEWACYQGVTSAGYRPERAAAAVLAAGFHRRQAAAGGGLRHKDRQSLRAVLEKWDVPIHIHDAMDVDLFAAVEAIAVKAHAAGWRAAYDDLHETPAEGPCVCGAPMWSTECMTRAHGRGPRPAERPGGDA